MNGISSGYELLYRETNEAMDDPRPGDRYQEMYSFWMYVVAVRSDGAIIVAEGSPPVTFPQQATFRGFGNADAFRRHYSYNGNTPGYFVRLASRDENVTGWLEYAVEIPEES
jgi:hypothetical protein